MEWLKNVLQWINDNYTLIVVIVVLIFSIYKKTKIFLSKSKEERIRLMKSEISGRILKMVSDAEELYDCYKKAGEIKRSQVISEIYVEYPELSKLVKEEELIAWIDDEINNALITLRKILEQNEIK